MGFCSSPSESPSAAAFAKISSASISFEKFAATIRRVASGECCRRFLALCKVFGDSPDPDPADSGIDAGVAFEIEAGSVKGAVSINDECSDAVCGVGKEGGFEPPVVIWLKMLFDQASAANAECNPEVEVDAVGGGWAMLEREEKWLAAHSSFSI